MKIHEKHLKVQSIARETMNYLSSVIVPGIAEVEIKNCAERFMLSRGIESFWYYDIGAFVFVGVRTTISISGRDYQPSLHRVGNDDIVTVDLSPCIGSAWGDLARTFPVGDNVPGYGIEFQKHLHRHLCSIISPDMSFDEIYSDINAEIGKHGFRNVDFNHNLGHTIEDEKSKRRYIEKGSSIRIKDIGLFTFEPHIQKANDIYGFKMENIYFHDGEKLREL